MNKYDEFYNKNENKTKLTFDELLIQSMMSKIKVNDKNYKVYDKNYLYKILNLSKYDYEVKNNIKRLISKCDKSFLYLSYIKAINYLLCKVKSENSINLLFNLKICYNCVIQ